MDVGVGSFVLANSLTAESHLRKSDLLGTLRSAIPMALLGLVRLVSVKSSNYQEHVTEYGVHWNFFCTLAVLPLTAVLGKELVGTRRLGVLGAILAVTYQLLLLGGLEHYIIEAPRVDLISMNKEGICSLFGYTSIFFLGVALGGELMRAKPLPEWYGTVGRLLLLDAGLWALLLALDFGGLEVSRRMANLPYVVWVLAYNIPLLVGMLYVDLAVGFARPPVLYEAINRNQLIVFLVANLATGAVNLSMRTLNATVPVALVILGVYAFTVSALAWLLHTLDLTLKFW